LLLVALQVSLLNNSGYHVLILIIASDCRGSVESSGRCADSSWSLWQGLNGNDFCCEVGLVGIYDYHNPVAGTCVPSAATGSATPAAIVCPQSFSKPLARLSCLASLSLQLIVNSYRLAPVQWSLPPQYQPPHLLRRSPLPTRKVCQNFIAMSEFFCFRCLDQIS
jgi:hypothetical protein